MELVDHPGLTNMPQVFISSCCSKDDDNRVSRCCRGCIEPIGEEGEYAKSLSFGGLLVAWQAQVAQASIVMGISTQKTRIDLEWCEIHVQSGQSDKALHAFDAQMWTDQSRPLSASHERRHRSVGRPATP